MGITFDALPNSGWFIYLAPNEVRQTECHKSKKAKTLVSTFILFNDKLTQNPIDELTGLFVRELLGKLNGFVDCYQLRSVKLCNFKDTQTQDIFLY